MDWLSDAFLKPTIIQAVIVICMVSALGLALGRIKFFGISLGITFVFFTGILAGHIGIGEVHAVGALRRQAHLPALLGCLGQGVLSRSQVLEGI